MAALREGSETASAVAGWKDDRYCVVAALRLLRCVRAGFGSNGGPPAADSGRTRMNGPRDAVGRAHARANMIVAVLSLDSEEGLPNAVRPPKEPVPNGQAPSWRVQDVVSERDDLDRRNVLVQRTTNGAQFLTDFSRMIDEAKDYIATIPARMIEFVVEQPAMAPSYDSPRQEWAIEAAE